MSSTSIPCLRIATRSDGADIVIATKDEDYGGRGFSCRDPEQHLRNVGTYDPWHAQS